MANSYSANVIFVDTTDASYSGPKYICAVKYLGNTSGTATIKKKDTNGKVLWEADGTADFVDEVEIASPQGIFVQVTNSAKVYIYLR